ncbi:hypothetical protein KC356_g221 [Hortaea werneckii]|nr:hypothetical protein KC356_g221 [Hortaea werneckii]
MLGFGDRFGDLRCVLLGRRSHGGWLLRLLGDTGFFRQHRLAVCGAASSPPGAPSTALIVRALSPSPHAETIARFHCQPTFPSPDHPQTERARLPSPPRVCGAAALSFSMRASIAPVEPGLGGASLVGDVVLLAACALIPACLRRMLASLRRQVSSRIMFFSWDFYEDFGQLAKELPPSIIILVVVTKESQNVVEYTIHLVQIKLKLFGLPPSLLHMALDNLAYSGLLHVFDIVNVLLRVRLELLDIQLLASEHTADVVLETFVLRVLLPDHAFDVVHQGGLIVRVLYHSKPCERRKLETNSLLVRVVHVIADIQNQAKHGHELHAVAQ